MERLPYNQKREKPFIEGGQAAVLRDTKKINDLTRNHDLNHPDVAIELYEKIVADPYFFETDTGKQFLRSLLKTAIHSEHYLSNEATISGRNLVREVKQSKEIKQSKEKKHTKEVKQSKEVRHSKEVRQSNKNYRRDLTQDETVRKMNKLKRSIGFHIKKWGLIALLAVMIGVFGSNLYEMIDYEIKSYQSEKKIEELISCILEPMDVTIVEENMIADLVASGMYPELAENFKDLYMKDLKDVDTGKTVLHQYSQLYKRNPDMAGWLRIDDTIINYPIMLTKEEEEYYLKRDFDKHSDINGLPFLDARCDIKTPTTNYLIYGHNMKNGSMFSKLLEYGEREFYEAHKTIVFDTVYEEGIYDILAVFQTRVAYQGEDVFRYYGMIQAEDEKEFSNYVKDVKEMSIYDTGVTATYGDQLLTLSTCDRRIDNGRFVVVARKRSL